MSKGKVKVTPARRNVFKDLGFDNADELQAEAVLAHEIYSILNERRLTQRAAAELLGIDQADVNKIMQGNYTGFSLRRLVRLLTRLDRDVELIIKRRPRSRGQARFTIKAA
jgi:predicted XRE-type DNA-binding protein